MNVTKAFLAAAAVFLSMPAAGQLQSVQLDYPLEELKAGIEGRVGFEVRLSKTGRVTGCKISETSGNVNLDKATCRQLLRTGRFKPATDAAGKPRASSYAGRLNWTIPREVDVKQ